MFGSQNPSMMNAGMYQQLLAMLQGGGSGGMPQPQNMAPQIAQQQHQPTSNISPVPQQQKPQQPGQPGGAVGGAVQAGSNLQKLYGMGQNAYNGINGAINGQTPLGGMQANPNAVSGSPVANTQAGNQYLMQNPGMAQQQGMQASGMQGAQGSQPFFGGMQSGQGASMYGTPGMAGSMPSAQGTMANFAQSPTASMFGSMGPTGAGAGTTFGSAAGGAAGGASTGSAAGTGAAADTSSSMPDWLSSILDAL